MVSSFRFLLSRQRFTRRSVTLSGFGETERPIFSDANCSINEERFEVGAYGGRDALRTNARGDQQEDRDE